ncbi:hypothetical protein WJX73_000137 [Symbiochloris irregularis]|uniref:Glycosyltransferase 61 catalytic domain-containing protein n=1 Tax=Symbiochloris irregularis TaxID=706552 RepID=A0AAW1NTW2_9CHLO
MRPISRTRRLWVPLIIGYVALLGLTFLQGSLPWVLIAQEVGLLQEDPASSVQSPGSQITQGPRRESTVASRGRLHVSIGQEIGGAERIRRQQQGEPHAHGSKVDGDDQISIQRQYDPLRQGSNNLLAVQVAGAQLSMSAGGPIQSSFSSFTCTGLQYGEVNGQGGSSVYGCPFCRTCSFQSVCLNHSSLEWQYYKGADNTAPLFYDMHGQAWHRFPPDFVSTAHVHIPPSYLDWAPKVKEGSIPEEAVFSSAPVAAYASLNDFAYNFGHALFDFLFPVFNALQLLNLYSPDFQLILAQHQGSAPEATMQRTRALPFRSAAFVNMGMPVERSLGKDGPRVTVLRKKGRRILENSSEILMHLQMRFPHAMFTSMDGDEIAVMGIKQQLEVMSATSILITPCGGTGTVLTFLQPGATAIVLNYWQNVAQTSVQMEAIYYWNLEYLDLKYFPVLPEDYEGTSDRPACEKTLNETHYQDQGAFIACNVRLKNLKRLEDVVRNALRRWALRHGHDAVSLGF